MRLYTFFDTVAVEHGPPFIAKNDGVANRIYQATLAERKAVTSEDIHLYYCATFDPESAEITDNRPTRVNITLNTPEVEE